MIINVERDKKRLQLNHNKKEVRVFEGFICIPIDFHERGPESAKASLDGNEKTQVLVLACGANDYLFYCLFLHPHVWNSPCL